MNPAHINAEYRTKCTCVYNKSNDREWTAIHKQLGTYSYDKTYIYIIHVNSGYYHNLLDNKKVEFVAQIQFKLFVVQSIDIELKVLKKVVA